MTVAQEEKTYQARFLTLEELAEVVVSRIKPNYSLFFETEDPCLVMLDENDEPVLWANGLRKIPFRFDDEEMFRLFCIEVAWRTRPRPPILLREHRPQPKHLAFIPPERLCRFTT